MYLFLKKTVSFLGAVMLLNSCAGKQIRVSSQPDAAKVFLTIPGESPQEIGLTPLTIENAQISSTEGAQIHVEKEGYKTKSIIVPASSWSITGKISVELEELSSSCSANQKSLDELARGIAKAQFLLTKQKFDEAVGILNTLKSDFSGVSVIYDLLGNAYYFKKEFSSALTAYKKSQELWPNNYETIRMIEKIERIRGI